MPSPLDHACEFILLERTVENGPSGPVVIWNDGVLFSCLLTLDNSMNARIGEQAGVTSTLTGLVDIETPLKFYDVFRRISDGRTYRITSEPDERRIPASASFHVKAFAAEKYELPKD